MTSGQVTSTITEIQGIGDTILASIGTVDPELALPAATATGILNLLSDMVSKALAALVAAQGTVIDAASIATLKADPTPLTPPTA